jgi:threonine/homoserine/homoserine lactone efflux protein
MKDLTVKSREGGLSHSKISSIKKGVLTNLLSPNPYIFWLTIGAPLLVSALQLSLLAGVLFILIFYILLVGFKLLLALFTDQVKSFFASKSFLYIIRTLGIVIIGFGVYLLYQGAAGLIRID